MQNLCLTFCRIKVSESLLSCLIFSFWLPNVIKPAGRRVHGTHDTQLHLSIDNHHTKSHIHRLIHVYFQFRSCLCRGSRVWRACWAVTWPSQAALTMSPSSSGSRTTPPSPCTGEAVCNIVIPPPLCPWTCKAEGPWRFEHCGNWERMIVGDIYWEITAKTFLEVTRCSIISRKKPNSYEMPLYHCTHWAAWWVTTSHLEKSLLQH